MAERDRKTIRYFIIGAILVLLEYGIRTMAHWWRADTYFDNALNLLRYIMHVLLLFAWCYSIQIRIINKRLKRCILYIGRLLIFWMLIRTVKYCFLPMYDPFGGMCWYLYYIPILMIPYISVLIAGFLGKSDSYQPSLIQYVLSIPSLILCFTVLTNDSHRLVFDFPVGIEFYDNQYTYEVIYYVIFGLILIEECYFVISIIRNSRVPEGKYSRVFRILPYLILLAGGAVSVLNIMHVIDMDYTAVISVVIVALIESNIFSGMIPSNTHYEEFFDSYTNGMTLIDENKEIYRSSSKMELSKSLIEKIEEGPVIEGNSLFSSSLIKGGMIIWEDDIGNLLNILNRLEAIRDSLSENNDLIKVEINLREQESRIQEKMRIYDEINHMVLPELKMIQDLTEKTADKKENLIQICFLGVFVKRYSNLLLLLEENEFIEARELELCFKETLNCLLLSSVSCSMNVAITDEKISLENAIVIYQTNQEILEAAWSSMNAVLYNLKTTEEEIQLRIQMGIHKKFSVPACQKLLREGGKMVVEQEENDVMFSLHIPSKKEKYEIS